MQEEALNLALDLEIPELLFLPIETLDLVIPELLFVLVEALYLEIPELLLVLVVSLNIPRYYVQDYLITFYE